MRSPGCPSADRRSGGRRAKLDLDPVIADLQPVTDFARNGEGAFGEAALFGPVDHMFDVLDRGVAVHVDIDVETHRLRGIGVAPGLLNLPTEIRAHFDTLDRDAQSFRAGLHLGHQAGHDAGGEIVQRHGRGGVAAMQFAFVGLERDREVGELRGDGHLALHLAKGARLGVEHNVDGAHLG